MRPPVGGDVPRNRAILVAALGGEGGGVLADWIATAIRRAGLLCQATSIPGVAQRTGATTYYLEYCEIPIDELGDRRVVFALTPVPGDVDVMVASELVEAARAVQNGYVTADRTTLIASSHRVYATSEKIAMEDGRFDAARALKAAHDLSHRAVIFDMERAAEEAGTVINAVLLGALAGSGALPIDPEHFEAAIEAGGKGVAASKRGYMLGLRAARGETIGAAPTAAELLRPGTGSAPLADVPVEARFVVGHGHARACDYQDAAYGDAYLERVRELLALDRALNGAGRGWRLTIEGARNLALRMTYEDVIRVADLKTRAERFAAVRAETRTQAGQLLHITEFLKPGLEEACAVLPPRLGEWLLGWARGRGIEHRLHVGLHVRSDTISGFLTMRLLANMRWLRRGSWRFAQESALTARWFEAVLAAARVDYDFGVAVAEAATLVKGYGSTYRRGLRNFDLLFEQVIRPAIADKTPAAQEVAAARRAAVADPEGDALDAVIARHRAARDTGRLERAASA
ncbi:indolepyruvate oxidoreductase subunit beta family protein [Xanthobacter pseudotagetidis]|uniref:indolepyruvate oxidoreductase subunit beta family protein n=1 Tax=Xanthobacter pseudotagetidis TaxID=3119911 RepID=UPI003727AD3F